VLGVGPLDYGGNQAGACVQDDKRLCVVVDLAAPPGSSR
jgi:hypothetical protein